MLLATIALQQSQFAVKERFAVPATGFLLQNSGSVVVPSKSPEFIAQSPSRIDVCVVHPLATRSPVPMAAGPNPSLFLGTSAAFLQ